MSLNWNPDVLTELVDYAFGGVDFAPPVELEVALWTGGNPLSPSDATAAAEMSGSGYARQTVPNDGTMWTLGVIVQSLQAVSWGPATANWPLIRAIVLIDKDVIPDRIMAVMTPVEPPVIATGDTLTAAIGDLQHHWGYLDPVPTTPPASSAWTDAIAQGLWNRLIGGDTSWTRPYEVELSLWVGDPYYDGVEVVGTGYSRLVFGNTTGSTLGSMWNTGAPVKTNKVPLRWPATGLAGTDWGNVTHVGVHEAASHELLVRAEGSSVVVRAGDALLIPPGKLRITADDFHR